MLSPPLIGLLLVGMLRDAVAGQQLIDERAMLFGQQVLGLPRR